MPALGTKMISVVVPAHNEEHVIRRCLAAITGGARSGELEVVVVCNGCSDGTAAEARRAGGERVTVIETAVASKTHALNLGDAAATGWPRLYLDADVVLSLESARGLARRLEEDGALAVGPEARRDLSGCSWAVRAYYDIDVRMPSARHGIGGSGVYGLSEAGRKRFEKFPAVTADDAFVRLHFTPDERERVVGCWSVVYPPRKLSGLVATMTRTHFGNDELRKLQPELWKNNGRSNNLPLLGIMLRPWLWAKLGVYLYVKLVARARAKQRLRQGAYGKWERDDTSREISRDEAPVATRLPPGATVM